MKSLGKLFFLSLLLTASQSLFAASINWVDWTASSTDQVVGTGSASGETIDVSYNGKYIGAQTDGGTNYWNPSDSYTNNTVVDNAPPASDIIRITGGSNALSHSITFSEPVVNPIMAVLSLGQPSITITYDFGDEEFSILSSGTGFWGGDPNGSLFEVTSSILTGVEGHGIIQFEGVYSSLTWDAPTFEYWHGFQVGFEQLESQLPPSNVPVPTAVWLFGSGIIGLIGLRRKSSIRSA